MEHNSKPFKTWLLEEDRGRGGGGSVNFLYNGLVVGACTQEVGDPASRSSASIDSNPCLVRVL